MVLMKRWSIIHCRMSTLLLPAIYNGQQNIYKKYSSIWIYILKPKSWLIDWLIEASSRPVQNSYVCKLWYTERKKLSHFDIKSWVWVTCGTKIRPGKVGNWRIFESKWLNTESQIDSTLRVKLTQHWESNWLNIESLIGSRLSQIGSILRVKLTQHWELNWLKYSPVTHFSRSNYNSATDSTFKVKMTQLFLSVHWEKKLSHFDVKSWITWVETKTFKLKKHLLYLLHNG